MLEKVLNILDKLKFKVYGVVYGVVSDDKIFTIHKIQKLMFHILYIVVIQLVKRKILRTAVKRYQKIKRNAGVIVEKKTKNIAGRMPWY